MGSLYVVGVPAGHPNDLTRRALRILKDVDLIVADDIGAVQGLLAHYDIAAPSMVAEEDAALATLAEGDVALVSSGWSPGLGGLGRRLIGAAVRGGFAVVSVPGAALPVTALVISGFPADSFVCLSELPEQRSGRRAVLAFLASDHRTLVVLERRPRLPAVLADLHMVLGDRSLVVVAASEQGTEVIWRGALGEAPVELGQESLPSYCALVIAGVREQPARWEEERLRAKIESLREQGLGAKEIGQQLAVESGWLRREIYRMAAETSRRRGSQSG